MNKSPIFGAAFIYGLFLAPLNAAPSRFFMEGETFFPSGSEESFEKDLQLNILGRRNLPDVQTDFTPGIRMGFLYPLRNTGDFGFSADYIMGPNSQATLDTGYSKTKLERDIGVARGLGEIALELPLGGEWMLQPGISAGLAFGKVRIKSASDSRSKSWSGLTWEISSGLVRRMKNTDLVLSLRYAGLPQYDDDPDKGFSPIDLDSFGISFRLIFGMPLDRPVRRTRRASRALSYDYPHPKVKRNADTDQEAEAPEPGPAPASEDSAETDSDYEERMKSAKEYFSAGAYQDAASAYGDAAAFLPEDDPRLVKALERKGKSLAMMGDCTRAKRAYTSALKKAEVLEIKNAAVVNAYIGLAYCGEQEGNLNSARANYRAAMKLSANPEIRKKIGRILINLRPASGQ